MLCTVGMGLLHVFAARNTAVPYWLLGVNRQNLVVASLLHSHENIIQRANQCWFNYSVLLGYSP